MSKTIEPNDLIQLLELSPLAGEGGYYRRTYAGKLDKNGRPENSVIYYLLTKDQPRSALHLLPIAETYHFYLGDPVSMIILPPEDKAHNIILGSDIFAEQQVQYTVPANCWHGSLLLKGGNFALLGTSMTPGYIDADYQAADVKTLQRQFPNFADQIAILGEK